MHKCKFENVLKKGTTGVLASALLFVGVAALAAPVARVANFNIARDILVLNAGQYAAIGYTVTNPGSTVELRAQKIDATGADVGAPTRTYMTGLQATMEATGVLKISADNATVFNQGAGTYKLTLYPDNVSGNPSKTIKAHMFVQPRFDEDAFRLTSGTSNFDSGDSMVLKQGAGQTLVPTFAYTATAAKTVLVAGNKEVVMKSGVATSVDVLPAGRYKAYLRGYNYADVNDAKRIYSNSRSYVNMTVLAQPTITAASLTGLGTGGSAAIGTKGGRCAFATTRRTAAGVADVEVRWTGKNLTKLVLSTEGVDYAIPTPNRTGVIYFQPDCLTTASHSFVLRGENTGSYQVTGVTQAITVNP